MAPVCYCSFLEVGSVCGGRAEDRVVGTGEGPDGSLNSDFISCVFAVWLWTEVDFYASSSLAGLFCAKSRLNKDLDITFPF